MCVPCFNKYGHDHRTENLSGEQQQSRKNAPKRPIKCGNSSLLHASYCRDANCRLRCCAPMKRMIAHTKSCGGKTNGSCLLCVKLTAMLDYHARYCHENNCPVPFCPNITNRLKTQTLQPRLQSTKLPQRRALMTSSRGIVSTSFASHISQPLQIQPAIPHRNPNMVNASPAMKDTLHVERIVEQQAAPSFSQPQFIQMLSANRMTLVCISGKTMPQTSTMLLQQQCVGMDLSSIYRPSQNTCPPLHDQLNLQQQQQQQPQQSGTHNSIGIASAHPLILSDTRQQFQQHPPPGYPSDATCTHMNVSQQPNYANMMQMNQQQRYNVMQQVKQKMVGGGKPMSPHHLLQQAQQHVSQSPLDHVRSPNPLPLAVRSPQPIPSPRQHAPTPTPSPRPPHLTAPHHLVQLKNVDSDKTLTEHVVLTQLQQQNKGPDMPCLNQSQEPMSPEDKLTQLVAIL